MQSVLTVELSYLYFCSVVSTRFFRSHVLFDLIWWNDVNVIRWRAAHTPTPLPCFFSLSLFLNCANTFLETRETKNTNRWFWPVWSVVGDLGETVEWVVRIMKVEWDLIVMETDVVSQVVCARVLLVECRALTEPVRSWWRRSLEPGTVGLELTLHYCEVWKVLFIAWGD